MQWNKRDSAGSLGESPLCHHKDLDKISIEKSSLYDRKWKRGWGDSWGSSWDQKAGSCVRLSFVN